MGRRGLVLVIAAVAVAVVSTGTGCDLGQFATHTNNIKHGATCDIYRVHRHVGANPNWYMGITTDIHGATSTCHADVAAYAARVSGLVNGGTYWSPWVWGHPAQANVSGVESSGYSEHQFCPNGQNCIYGSA